MSEEFAATPSAHRAVRRLHRLATLQGGPYASQHDPAVLDDVLSLRVVDADRLARKRDSLRSFRCRFEGRPTRVSSRFSRSKGSGSRRRRDESFGIDGHQRVFGGALRIAELVGRFAGGASRGPNCDSRPQLHLLSASGQVGGDALLRRRTSRRCAHRAATEVMAGLLRLAERTFCWGRVVRSRSLHARRHQSVYDGSSQSGFRNRNRRREPAESSSMAFKNGEPRFSSTFGAGTRCRSGRTRTLILRSFARGDSSRIRIPMILTVVVSRARTRLPRADVISGHAWQE